MSEETIIEPEAEPKKSFLERFYLQDGHAIIWTLLYAIVGAVVFALVYMISMPYMLVSLFKFGLVPALAIIPTIAALRGPIAGFLTGYLGIVVYDLLASGAVVTLTLPAIGYGILGFVVGLSAYDFTSGKSLIRLSILSIVGYVFTVLIVVAVGMTVESLATLVVLGYVMLPLLTVGIPSVILITPLFVWIWHHLTTKFGPEIAE